MEIHHLLDLAVQKEASDLHLTPGSRVMLRMQGELVPISTFPVLDASMTELLIFNLMDENLKKDFKEKLEIDFAVSKEQLGRFRVSVFQQIKGIAAVIRLIPNQIPTLQQLQLPDVFKQLIQFTHGLILITGTTGCGKSTTLAAMINAMNDEQSKHIITIEDPIEFLHSNKNSIINQRQLRRDTPSFTAALRSALRADPDVIMLGELRDPETIRLALTAAETGHLVLATLHTHSAPQTINRVIDIFHANEKNMVRSILAESLQAVISQKLIKKVDGARKAIFEIMVGTPAVRNLIREDKISQLYNSIQTGREFGMCTFEQYL